MLRQSTYSNGTQAATVALERTDVLLKSETEVLCFPRLIELGGDRLVLVYLKKWHELGGQKTQHAALSEDFGRTWTDLGKDDDGYVLHAYEATGQATAAVIECSMLGTTLALEFGPCEIKTVKIGDNGTVEETDLLEMSKQS